MTAKLFLSITTLLALVAVGILFLLSTFAPTPSNQSDWAPLNNGYPGWSNKVQPF